MKSQKNKDEKEENNPPFFVGVLDKTRGKCYIKYEKKLLLNYEKEAKRI